MNREIIGKKVLFVVTTPNSTLTGGIGLDVITNHEVTGVVKKYIGDKKYIITESNTGKDFVVIEHFITIIWY
jgi:hypothetical protein